MSGVTNDALDRLREIDKSIEGLNDAIQYVLANPHADLAVHAALKDSGYFDAWRFEVEAKRWQYDRMAFDLSKDSPAEKQKYCKELIRQREVHGLHHDANIVQLTEYVAENDLATLRALLEIDKRMISLLDLRVDIANSWLRDHCGANSGH